MDIKNWASVISVIAIVSGVLIVIIPENKIKKIYNIIVTLFLIYAFLLPFNNKTYSTFDLNRFLKSNENLKQEYNEKSLDIFEESAKSVLESKIEEKFKNSGIDAKVNIECKVEEDAFIIDKISVICSSTQHKSIITKILDEFKTEYTKIVFEGE